MNTVLLKTLPCLTKNRHGTRLLMIPPLKEDDIYHFLFHKNPLSTTLQHSCGIYAGVLTTWTCTDYYIIGPIQAKQGMRVTISQVLSCAAELKHVADAYDENGSKEVQCFEESSLCIYYVACIIKERESNLCL